MLAPTTRCAKALGEQLHPAPWTTPAGRYGLGCVRGYVKASCCRLCNGCTNFTLGNLVVGLHHLGQQLPDLLDRQLLAADVFAFVLLIGRDLNRYVGELGREEDSGLKPRKG
jgi:hypothetical protein